MEGGKLMKCETKYNGYLRAGRAGGRGGGRPRWGRINNSQRQTACQLGLYAKDTEQQKSNHTHNNKTAMISQHARKGKSQLRISRNVADEVSDAFHSRTDQLVSFIIAIAVRFLDRMGLVSVSGTKVSFYFVLTFDSTRMLLSWLGDPLKV
jgi:hypothetical protein